MRIGLGQACADPDLYVYLAAPGAASPGARRNKLQQKNRSSTPMLSKASCGRCPHGTYGHLATRTQAHRGIGTHWHTASAADLSGDRRLGPPMRVRCLARYASMHACHAEVLNTSKKHAKASLGKCAMHPDIPPRTLPASGAAARLHDTTPKSVQMPTPSILPLFPSVAANVFYRAPSRPALGCPTPKHGLCQGDGGAEAQRSLIAKPV